MKNLRTLYLSILLLIFVSSQSSGQSFREGSNVGSIGVGLGGSLLASGSFSSSTPALSLQFEHGQWEVGGPGTISLGGYIGYKSYKYSTASLSAI